MFDWLRKNLENIFETPESRQLHRQQAIMHAYLAKINPLVQTRRYTEALSYLNGWIEDDTTNYVAFRQRGYCKYLIGDYEDAIVDFTESIRLKPHLDHRVSYFYRAWANFALKNFGTAIADCNRILEQTPYDTVAIHLRGSALLQQKQFNAALQDAEQVIAIDPTNGDGYVLRAAAHLNLNGDLDDIIADCNRALELHSRNPFAYINRAMAYLKQRQHDQALADLEQAEQLDSNEIVIYIYRGHILNDLERYTDALDVLNSALKLNPTSYDAYYQITRAHYELRNDADVLSTTDKMLEHNPARGAIYIFRAAVYARQKQYVKAYAEYDRAIEVDSKYYFVYVSRAMIRVQYGLDYDEALTDINWAMTLRTDDVQLYAYRGLVYLYRMNLDEAMRDFQQSIDNMQRLETVYHGRAHIHFLRGNYNQALADFEQHTVMNAHLPKYGHAGQAVTLYAMGKHDEAIALWREIVTEDARFADADWLPFKVFDAEPLLEIARKLIAQTQNDDTP